MSAAPEYTLMSRESERKLSMRIADARDVPTLVEFNRAMARETEDLELAIDVLTEGVENLLHSPQYGFYVVAEESGTTDADGGAEVVGEVVGSLMVTYEWSDWRNGLFWWIQSVYVRPPARRRGIYRKLYEFVRSLAANEPNVRGFRLYVERQNLPAQQTYARLGMNETHYKMFEELREG
jgi:ribosomal protein S18 acetylase RimI-like enzyme